MTADDIAGVEGFLPIGLFQGLSDQDRRAAFLICFDVERFLKRFSFESRLARYTENQPLFQMMPGLFEHTRNGELLPYTRLRHGMRDGEVVEYDRGYAVIDYDLNPMIVHWFAHQFPKAPMWVRLHPARAQASKPLRIADEAIVRPANPTWWKQIELYRGNHDGAEYRLIDPGSPTQENQEEYWQYYMRRARALEVSCKRDNGNRLTMMVEELSYKEQEAGMLIGRCLHLDTDDPAGTDASKAVLNHLDLALQVYTDERVVAREQHRLADGKVPDATFRAHLFRIEQIPFTAMLAIPHLFFQSRVLVDEWLNDQFPGWRAAFERIKRTAFVHG